MPTPSQNVLDTLDHLLGQMRRRDNSAAALTGQILTGQLRTCQDMPTTAAVEAILIRHLGDDTRRSLGSLANNPGWPIKRGEIDGSR